MKRISILTPYDAVPATVTDPHYMFTVVNQFLQENGRDPAFLVQLVGLTPTIQLYKGVFSINPDALIDAVDQTDLVIIPGLAGDIKASLHLNRELIPWIIKQYNNGATVASLSNGAFLLAATGLLNGRECSTHWLSAKELKRMFPKVSIADGNIISERDRLFSSGEACAYWNLLLHMVEKYADRELADQAAKYFAIEFDRKVQSPFFMFNVQKKHEDEPIRQAQEFIEKHVGMRLSVEDLASRFAIGRRNFIRRFKKATNNTPSEYIQRVKIEAAKKELENGLLNISEVMYRVGYNDVKTFRAVFKKITGLCPLDYRNKYSRAVAAA